MELDVSADPPARDTAGYRHCITDIEISPGNTDPNSKFSARLFVDEELICNLPWIDHTRPLRWSGLLPCDASPLSKISLRLCKSTKEKPRYFNFPPIIVSEVDEETGESTLEIPKAVWVVTIKSLTSTMTEQLFPGELNKLGTIEGQYDDLDPDETVKYLFKSVLRFGKFAIEALPKAASKFSFLVYMKAWEVLDQQTRINEPIKGILRGLNSVEEILDSVDRTSNVTLPTAMDQSKEAIDKIRALLEEISIYILDRHAANDLVREPPEEADSNYATDAEAYLARLEDLPNAFHSVWPAATDTSHVNSVDAPDNEPSGTLWQIVQTGDDESTDTPDPYEILNVLRPMDPGDYDPEKACLDGTRESILNQTVTWTQNREHSEKLMWISGQAGMGKTSIATSLCQRLDKIGALAGSLFCQCDNPDSSDPLRLINNLVHAIALNFPPYAHEVANAIRAKRSLCTSHFNLRYEGLVKKPLERLKSLSTPTMLVVVVDALDEFGDRDSRQRLLQKFHEISRLVSWLRVVFTSRPDRGLQEYHQQYCPQEPIIHLHTYDASDDIRAYIEGQLGKHPQMKSWPQGSLDQLSSMAQGVFTWATLATKYIQKSTFSSLSRLQKVLDNQQSPVTDYFDSLYTRTLVTALEDNEDEMQDVYSRCIAAIISTSGNKPLTKSSLQYLPLVIGQVNQQTIEQVLRDLSPLLISSDGQYAKFYHSSFKDYISDRSRSGRFFIPLGMYDAEHQDYCLQVMQKDLRFNICDLETSYLLNSEVPDLRLRIRSHITPALKYACIHWIDHFIFSPSQVTVKAIKEFLEGPQLFFWIEALTLLGRLDVAMNGISKLTSLELTGFDDWNIVTSWINDLHRFLSTYRDVITASTPHLYISALAFAPAESVTAKRMRPHFPKTITISQGGDLNWHPCIKDILHPRPVQSLSISPDGLTVIVGYPDGSLGVWDKETSARVRGPFTGHTGSVMCIAFSSNGSRIASSSYDTTIRVWDVAGNLKTSSVLTGHSGPVHSVAFSPNATFIASGSSDKTIRLWDPNVTRPISEPYVGHSGSVNSVAFSLDGTKLVSGSQDKTIRIWSVDSKNPKLAGNPLLITGHSDSITCVAFSPDGSKVASGSADKSLQMWDAQSGNKIKAHKLPANHSNGVTSISFSPNGRLIASSTSNGAVQIWDVTTLKAISCRFGHNNSVNGVVFLPDNSHIVSGSTDQTTRVWDTSALPEPIPGASFAGHSSPILSIAPTSDGTRVISVSNDQTVCTWDPQTGAQIDDPCAPPSKVDISCAAISPDGTQIMFSNGNNIQLWSTSPRAIVNSHQHNSEVTCAAFSPDGALIAMGCVDSKVYFWELSQWKTLGNPLQAESGPVLSVAFSPNGATLASVTKSNSSYSGHGTIVLWDTKTKNRSSGSSGRMYSSGSITFSPCGTQLISAYQGYMQLWNRQTGSSIRQLYADGHSSGPVAFSPDGAYIAFGSPQGSVWLWDAKTGQQIGSPFAKHSAAVTSAVFLPDGKYLITGSQDKTIQVWDTSYSGYVQTKDHSGAYCWPNNPLRLSNHPHHPGWTTLDRKSLVFWLPAHYQNPGKFFNTLPQGSRPSAFLNYQQFVHGTDWTSVASDSVKKRSE